MDKETPQIGKKVKATRAEKVKRIAEVAEMLVGGYSYHDIVRHNVKKYSIHSRQVDVYIAEVYKLWKERAKIDIDGQFDKHIATRQKLYLKVLSAKKIGLDGVAVADENIDYKTALAIQMDIAKLQGFYVEKIEHTGSIGIYKDLSPEQRQARIEELEKKRLELRGTEE